MDLLQKENQLIRMQLFNGLCWLLMGGAAMWAAICIFLGVYTPAIIPIGYIVFTLINRFLMNRTSGLGPHAFLQILLSLTLPCLFQIALGGIEQSGMVMVWAFVPLTAALGFYRRRKAMAWLAFLVASMVLLAIFDPGWVDGLVIYRNSNMQRTLLAVNMGFVTFLIFGIALAFVRVQGRSRRKMFELQQKLAEANELVAERNGHLENSMSYARRIQTALLPNDLRHPDIFSEYFSLIKQKEQVGGDSFWYAHKGDHVVMALIDCTGHGVPGSLLSMMVHEILTSGFNHQDVNSPAQLIKFLFLQLMQKLNNQDDLWNDNAEVAIIEFDRGTGTLKFSGTSMDLVVLTPDGVQRTRGRGTIFTKDQAERRAPIDQQVSLDPRGSSVYLFSDGVIDQFNADQSQRFTSDRLMRTIEEIGQMPFATQKATLQNELDAWQGDGPQTDDLSFVGFQLSAKYLSKIDSGEAVRQVA